MPESAQIPELLQLLFGTGNHRRIEPEQKSAERSNQGTAQQKGVFRHQGSIAAEHSFQVVMVVRLVSWSHHRPLGG